MDIARENEHETEAEEAEGIVIFQRFAEQRPPAILRFIWGGKVRPAPTLPFGRSAA
jgi:hypothetical protein